MSLTDRQERFAREYAATGSAKDAALKAGYSPGRAKQSGHEQLQKPEVRTRVAELQEARAVELDIDARDLVTEAMWFVRAAKDGKIPASAGVRALDVVARLVGAYTATKHQVEEKRLIVTMHLGTE